MITMNEEGNLQKRCFELKYTFLWRLIDSDVLVGSGCEYSNAPNTLNWSIQCRIGRMWAMANIHSCKSWSLLLHAAPLLNHPLLFCEVALLFGLLHSANLRQLPIDDTASECLALPRTPAPRDSPKGNFKDEQPEEDAPAVYVAAGNRGSHSFEGQTACCHNYLSANMAIIDP